MTASPSGGARAHAYLAYAMAAGVPCVYLPIFRDPYVTPKVAAIGLLAVLGAGATWGVGKARVTASGIDIPILVFVCTAVLAIGRTGQ